MMNRTRGGPDAGDVLGIDVTRLHELFDDPVLTAGLDEHDAYGLDDDTREAAATLDALTEAIRASRAAAAAHAPF